MPDYLMFSGEEQQQVCETCLQTDSCTVVVCFYTDADEPPDSPLKVADCGYFVSLPEIIKTFAFEVLSNDKGFKGKDYYEFKEELVICQKCECSLKDVLGDDMNSRQIAVDKRWYQYGRCCYRVVPDKRFIRTKAIFE